MAFKKTNSGIVIKRSDAQGQPLDYFDLGTCTQTHTHTYACIHANTQTHTYACIHANTQTHTYACIHANTQTHTYTYTR